MPLPLSANEEKVIRDLVDAYRDSVAIVEAEKGSPLSGERWWEQEALTVTEVAVDHGGIGRDETLATFHNPTGVLLAHVSALPDTQASSLLLVDSWRGPLLVRFRPYKRKRATLRFLVGSPGHRGSVWRLWTGVTGDDIYLGDRHSTKWSKFSLHASGDYRLQWNTPDRDEVRAFSPSGQTPDGRIIARWDAPEGLPAGWSHVLSIFTTADDVVDVPDDNQTHRSPVFVPAPDDGWMVEFAIYIVTPDAGLFDMSSFILSKGRQARLVGGYLLPGGRTVIVWAFTRPIPPGVADALAVQRKASLERVLPTRWNLHPASGPRTFAIRLPAEGQASCEVWDLGLTPLVLEWLTGNP